MYSFNGTNKFFLYKEKDDKQKSLTSFFVFGIIRDVVKL